jgi:hypothetical protein
VINDGRDDLFVGLMWAQGSGATSSPETTTVDAGTATPAQSVSLLSEGRKEAATMLNRTYALALLVVSIGCSAGEPEPALADLSSAIIGGTETSARPEVIRLVGITPGNDQGCTGTLIGGRVFLTAAHCAGFGN